MYRCGRNTILALLLFTAGRFIHAESGADAWLRYAPIHNPQTLRQYGAFPSNIVTLDSSEVAKTAASETARGIASMLGRTLHSSSSLLAEDALILGTIEEQQALFPSWKKPDLRPEGYWLGTVRSSGHTYLLIAGADPRGILYGAFDLLSKIAREENLASLDESHSPSAPIRWINQWDNLDGSIERGYGGRSLFFDAGSVRPDLTRASEYARLMASIGINGCTVNNVNADLRTLTPEFIAQLARIADAFRPWGVKLSISVALSSPKAIGGLDTFDPKDPKVIAWWRAKTDELYAKIPDLGGFEVKADSEGQAGPSQYGRTPVDAANMLAAALKPHGGVLLYRAFVYNHHLDWTDPKADRARAAYDIFHPLDGQFADNVIVQIKYGPIDFQVREPASPLFAGLQHTSEAIEVQSTQEYTGQQRHLVFLVPLWKTVLDFDMRAQNRATPVKEIVEGKSFHRPLGGFVAVANLGLDTNWLGHPLALANLYGFGRLAWDPNTSAETIADDWTKLTFGPDPLVDSTIDAMLLHSWHIYEQYTGPLGLGTLTDILHGHYGPGIETAERNGWGQWIRADHDGLGMDRTIATGTGYIGQYPPEVAHIYESLQTCPDALLLFMHHVPYTYRLHSGETVIQSIYDSHYAGADAAAQLVKDWQTLKGRIDDERYEKVLALQEYQAGHAIVWRDAVVNWFHKESGIEDTLGRVGHDPNRIEAESMQLAGYTPIDITPWETASAGKAVVCKDHPTCSATTTLARPAGRYDIAIQYFDLHNAASTYKVLLNRHEIGHWTADATLPGSDKLNGDSSTRHVLTGITLHPGDRLEIEGTPDSPEPAPLDYIEITPTSQEARP